MATTTVTLHAYGIRTFPRKEPDAATNSILDVSISEHASEVMVQASSEHEGQLELQASLEALGLDEAADDHAVLDALDSLVLAMNLCSTEGVFSMRGPEKHLPSIKREPSADAEIEGQEASTEHAVFSATPRLRAKAKVIKASTVLVDLDGTYLFYVYENIQRVKEVPGPTNRKKALGKIRSAASTHEVLDALDRYAAAIEILVNADGAELSGSDLDEVVAQRSHIDETTARDIRRLYNRTKHPDRGPSDRKRYERLRGKADELVVAAKRTAGEIGRDVLRASDSA